MPSTRTLTALLLLSCATTAFGTPRGAQVERSCEAWQAEAEQLGHLTPQRRASVKGQQPVTVFAAPAGSCACAGSTLKPSSVVLSDLQFKGFVRILYLNAASGEQVSGWVTATKLRQIRPNRPAEN